ncbi:uncharacterized protein involved in exopolysaccharide biosynthesis/Mrp family chromosome partitioning ATPase [Rhizobium alvei]|uniref:Wzz/FepE/Etk N-terminal domain-containing protein n=1 Tax=Rhizobium alvei TaxID=1132659 RepID=A0ABT8YJD6_9HYPH|nr:Wzz/FepE/Etk N-terminal domain-containing protein [Rhizobium alvei]MDO6963795.1 Wzz/FepE/Etk N-terminal domain-containing protein [Rhizobium alvei]
MAGGHLDERDADIDLAGLISALWRRKRLILLSTVVLGGLAFAGASVVSPKYQSESRILIETRTPDFARNQNATPQAEPLLDEAGVASQVALLQSADLIKQVARDLKLDELREFDPYGDPSIVTRLMVMVGLMKNPLDVPPEERVLNEFVRKLQVYQVEKSRVIAIQFSSKDARLAAEIPNAMAKVYLSLQAGAKLDTTSEAAKWLEPEIANLREKVREAEAKVASYRASSNIFRTGEQNTFSETQLNDISQELARVRGERANAEARAESVRSALKSGRDVETIAEVVGSPMIQRLKETQSGIEGQIADLSTSLLDGHPKLKALRSQRQGIAEQIRRETQKILASLESEANVAKLREQQLLQQLNSVKADNANGEEKEVGLKALEREATAQRQLLETYLARYREAVSKQDMNATPADARVVSQATVASEPYFPKVLPITIVAALAGFLMSSVFVMLAELFSGRALRPVDYGQDEDAEGEEVPVSEPAVRTVAVPAVVNAPAAEEAKAEKPVASLLSMAFEDNDQAMATDAEPASELSGEEFSVEAVARHLIDNNVGVALAISPTGDEGSNATVALARAIAEHGLRTLLIDMTGSALPTGMMAESARLPGITDLLSGDASIAETLHGDRYSDAHILPQGNADAKRAMRGADRLSMIVDALAEAYDHVIVECGPANVDGVRRLARNGRAEIVLSAGTASDAQIEAVANAFIEAGYEDVVLLLGSDRPDQPRNGRHAA